MALIKWRGGDLLEPFRDLTDLREEMSRLFGRSLLPARWPLRSNGHEWWPEVDVVEEKDRILVRADLPGMKQEDIEVEVGDGVLTIKGERQQEAQTQDNKAYRLERSYGSFQRSVALPAGIDPAKINAAYKNGILEVALPKREEARAKKVKVEVK